MQALDQDLEHTRAHKRFHLRAIEWEGNHRSKSFLLKGDEITQAEQWLSEAYQKEPKPTDLHAAYIHTSRTEANRRLRTQVGLMSAALAISLAMAVMAFFMYFIADRNLHQARIFQAQFLGREALSMLQAGEPRAAYWMAMGSLAYREDEGIESPNSITTLSRIQTLPFIELAQFTHFDWINGTAWTQTHEKAVTYSYDTRAILWSANGEQLRVMPHDGAVFFAAWNDDDSRILTVSDNTLYLWDANGLPIGEPHEFEGSIQTNWTGDGHTLFVYEAGGDKFLYFLNEDGDNIADKSFINVDGFRQSFLRPEEQDDVEAQRNRRFALWQGNTVTLLTPTGDIIRQQALGAAVTNGDWTEENQFIAYSNYGAVVLSAEGDVLLAYENSDNADERIMNIQFVDNDTLIIYYADHAVVVGMNKNPVEIVHDELIEQVTVGDNGMWIASSDRMIVKIWSDTGELVEEFPYDDELELHWLDDGNQLAIVKAKELIIWRGGSDEVIQYSGETVSFVANEEATLCCCC